VPSRPFAPFFIVGCFVVALYGALLWCPLLFVLCCLLLSAFRRRATKLKNEIKEEKGKEKKKEDTGEYPMLPFLLYFPLLGWLWLLFAVLLCPLVLLFLFALCFSLQVNRF